MTGQQLAHYRIIEKIGAGGMGIVYRARDERLERDVALKVLSAGVLADEAARRRFRNEALALSRLNHPNIATVHDFNTHEGIDFLILEYIPGEALRERLIGGALPEKEVLRIGLQLAQGLAAAHERGVLHLDLKPGNLRITPDGWLKILDFGLAALRHAEADAATTATATRDHGFAGTLPYMAPEQVRGDRADIRTDIYGAGMVLYEMATGRRPFPETRSPQLIAAVLEQQPPPPRRLNPKISPGIENIIVKAVDKDPERRYQSAKELAVDLDRATGPIPEPVTKPKPTWRRAVLAVAALVAATALLAPALKWWQERERNRGPVPEQKHLAVLPFRAIGGGAENQAYCDGLTETVTAKLGQLTTMPGLQVVPAREIRSRNLGSAAEAHKSVGANLALEGTVHQSGDTLRINYALVAADTLRQLRADTITAPASNPFALQDSVVAGAVRMLELHLKPRQQESLNAHGTQVAGAHEFYLTGRGYLQSYDRPENIDNAITVFERALKLDQGYALAYAGLGEAYWKKYERGRDTKWVETAQHHCQQALTLDANLPAAHICLGTLYNGRGQPEKAVSEFERALEQEPTSDDAYRGMAVAQEHLGKLQEAEQTYRRAIELRPHYWAGYSWLGTFFYRRARYREAAEQFEQAAALTPDNSQAYYLLGAVYAHLDRYNDATTALRKSIQLRPSYEAYSNLGSVYMRERKFEDAISMYEQAIKLSQQDYRVCGYLARAYYWAPGRRGQAQGMYERAVGLGQRRLEINAHDADAQILLATDFAMLGRRREALDHLRRALEPPPEDPEFFALAAVVHNQFGGREAAVAHLQKAIARGYTAGQLKSHIELDDLVRDAGIQALLRPK